LSIKKLSTFINQCNKRAISWQKNEKDSKAKPIFVKYFAFDTFSLASLGLGLDTEMGSNLFLPSSVKDGILDGGGYDNNKIEPIKPDKRPKNSNIFATFYFS